MNLAFRVKIGITLIVILLGVASIVALTLSPSLVQGFCAGVGCGLSIALVVIALSVRKGLD